MRSEIQCKRKEQQENEPVNNVKHKQDGYYCSGTLVTNIVRLMCKGFVEFEKNY